MIMIMITIIIIIIIIIIIRRIRIRIRIRKAYHSNRTLLMTFLSQSIQKFSRQVKLYRFPFNRFGLTE